MSSSGQHEHGVLGLQATSLSLQGAEPVWHVELVADHGPPGLVTSSSGARGETILRLYHLGMETPPAAATRQAAPVSVYAATFTLPASMSVPQWTASMLDGAPSAGGVPSATIVMTQPGSAMSPLALWRSNDAAQGPTRITPDDGLRVFSAPRFVKHAPDKAPGPATAIEAGAKADVVVRLDPPSGNAHAFTAHVLFAPVGGRVHAAVLARASFGHVLFFKIPSAGADARPRPRPPFGDVSIGTVEAVRFDRDGKVIGAPVVIPMPEPCYEFDADLDGDRLLVIGTTRAGYAVTAARFDGPRLVVVGQGERALATPAVAPALLATGGAVVFALLQSAPNAAPTVIYGRL